MPENSFYEPVFDWEEGGDTTISIPFQYDNDDIPTPHLFTIGHPSDYDPEPGDGAYYFQIVVRQQNGNSGTNFPVPIPSFMSSELGKKLTVIVDVVDAVGAPVDRKKKTGSVPLGSSPFPPDDPA